MHSEVSNEPERPGGLEVDDQLDFRGLHDREVSRLLAFENAPGVDAAQTICVRSIASVAHQTTGGGKLSILVDRWNAVAEGECAELRGVAAEQRIGAADHERGCSQLRRRCEGGFEVGFGACVECMKPHAECIGYGLQVFRNRRSEWICGVDKQSNGRRPGEQLTREFEPLRRDLQVQARYAREIAAWSAHAGDKTQLPSSGARPAISASSMSSPRPTCSCSIPCMSRAAAVTTSRHS